MKPKERKSQKQTARLFLRRNEHRDIIFNKIYHNAIFLYKLKRDSSNQPTNEIETRDYVWFKYPKHALLTINTSERIANSGSGIDVALPGFRGWVDIDRQFHYAVSEGGASGNIALRGNRYIRRGKYVICVNMNVIYYTEDGIRWFLCSSGIYYNITNQAQASFEYHCWTQPFGQNWFCGLSDAGMFHLYKLNIDEGRYNDIMLKGDYDSVNLIPEGQQSNEHGPEIGRKGGYVYYAWTKSRRTIAKYLSKTNSGALVLKVSTTDYRTYEWSGGSAYQTSITCQDLFTYLHIDESCNPDIAYYWEETTSNAAEDYTFNPDKFNVITTFNMGNTVIIVFSTNRHENSVDVGSGGMTYDRWHNYIYVATSINNGYDWTIVELEEFRFIDTTKHVYTRPNAQAFFRKGKYYIMCSAGDIEGYKVHLYSSLNGATWDEIIQPKAYVLPVAATSGAYTRQIDDQEFVKIAVSPLEYPNYDYMMHDLYGNVLGNISRGSYSGYYNAQCWSDIRFSDGKIDDSNDSFFISLGGRPVEAYDGQTYYDAVPAVFAYIDMEHHSKDFAMIFDLYDGSNREIPEEVIEYDYCAPAGGFSDEDPDPDLHYVYYVWKELEQEYQVVDRHLSTYAGYTIVYVNELPEVGQIQTLYGIKTDINSNPIYDYYIWSAEDGMFTEIQDLTIYARYTLIIVEALPTTGRLFIIYAVPKDTDSYDTNMYIWNPDAIRYIEDGTDDQGNPIYIEVHGDYESISTTEYEMLGKTYRVVNVVSLPERGHIGIIYISEKKYTPHEKSYEDKNYNYYLWDTTTLKFVLCSPVINKAKYEVITVETLLPPDPSMDTSNIIWRIAKELDGKNIQNLWPSENDLINYLKTRTDRHDQWLNNKDELPFVGVSNIFYIVRETPGEFTGFYNVYMWNKQSLSYRHTNTYEYLIKENPEDPSLLDRLVTKLEDIVVWDNN